MKNLPPLPTPSKSKKKILRQAEIDLDLWQAVEREMKLRNDKIREAMTYGFQAYLLKTNPKAAEKLGILPDKE